MIGTKFNIIDLSKIPEQTVIETPDAAPVILTAFPAAKGTEKLVELSGTDYRTMFGDPDYKKYGQVSVQNQRMIDAGAKLLCKRVVASDAKLSSVTVLAKVAISYVDTDVQAEEEVTKEQPNYILGPDGKFVQDTEDGRPKVDEEGNPVYKVDQENPTVSVTTTEKVFREVEGVQVPVMEKAGKAVITYIDGETHDAYTIDDITEKYGKQGRLVDGKPIAPTTAEEAATYDISVAEDEVLFIPNAENTLAAATANKDINGLVTACDITDDESYNGVWVVKKDAVTGVGSAEQALSETATLDKIVGTYKIFPIMTIAEIGRGSSKKSFTLTPENAISKNLSFMYYTMNIIEDGATIETIRFSMLPDTIYNGQCIDLNMVASSNLNFTQAHCYEDTVMEFIKTVAVASGAADEEEYSTYDFIYGTLRKGTALPGIEIDESGLAMNSMEVSLISPADADGSFGSSPALNKPELITEKLLAFYKDEAPASSVGQYTELDATDDIYDLDSYQIDAVYDANLDIRVKDAIVDLANYRGDFVFFRDHGNGAVKGATAPKDYLDVASRIDGTYYQEMLSDEDYVLPKSTYVSDWVQSYSVINPYDMKEIDVTINYDLSANMIPHILNQVNVPYAGKRNNAVITSIIKDSINYKPRVTPSANEKEELEDIKCNFGSYYKDSFVIETLWTSQEDYTQLSFINNVMAVQKVIKALRVHFPSIRYQFITSSEDLQAYTTNINEFLSSYTNMFAELRFEYIQDSVAAANKIYRAALYFRFNDFAQGEQIDAYMLPTEIITG